MRGIEDDVFIEDDDEFIQEMAHICRSHCMDVNKLKQEKLKAAISGDNYSEHMADLEIEFQKRKKLKDCKKEKETDDDILS